MLIHYVAVVIGEMERKQGNQMSGCEYSWVNASPSSLSHVRILSRWLLNTLNHSSSSSASRAVSLPSISTPLLSLGLQSFISTSRNNTWPVLNFFPQWRDHLGRGRRRKRRGGRGGERERGGGGGWKEWEEGRGQRRGKEKRRMEVNWKVQNLEAGI